jgi:hypothetical protein
VSQHQCKYCKGEYSTEENHYCSFAEGWLPAPAESKQTYETMTQFRNETSSPALKGNDNE